MASPRGYLDSTLTGWLGELAQTRGAPGGGGRSPNNAAIRCSS